METRPPLSQDTQRGHLEAEDGFYEDEGEGTRVYTKAGWTLRRENVADVFWQQTEPRWTGTECDELINYRINSVLKFGCMDMTRGQGHREGKGREE